MARRRRLGGDDFMLRVRLKPAERRLLNTLARSEGVTASDLVRLSIRRLAERFRNTRPRVRQDLLTVTR